MTLAYDARRSTRDIDAVFHPHGVVEEAWAAAGEVGPSRWWLNEQASSYAARGGDQNAPHVFDHLGLRVSAASPERLLAMKVLAGRRRDADDITYLVKHLGLTTSVVAPGMSGARLRKLAKMSARGDVGDHPWQPGPRRRPRRY